jgi:cytochrome c oxidase assembly protein subunit 15
MDFLDTPTALRRWTVASLLANMTLVVTGGLVRVTGSGLGCSTWPQCEPGSYLPHPEAGLHAFIEFGNRLLTFVLVAVAIGTLLAAWRARLPGGVIAAVDRSRAGSDGPATATLDPGAPRTRLRRLALAAALGIPAQAVIGGLSVLAGLNPWVVGLHMAVSVALVVLCVLLVHEAYDVAAEPVTARVRLLVRAVFYVGLLAMALGVVVTGAGPNSGAGGAHRNGLELSGIARVHSLTVWLVVAATVTLLWLVRRDTRVRPAVVTLLAVEVLQGAVGYAQYALALPPALVVLHMLGTALFTAAIAHLWWLTRDPA